MNTDYPGRLFWKMLLLFWLVFLIISQFLWLGFSMFGNFEPPSQKEARRMLNLQLESAVSAVQAAGPEGIATLTAGWPENMKQVFRVSVSPQQPGRLLPLTHLPATGGQGGLPQALMHRPDSVPQTVSSPLYMSSGQIYRQVTGPHGVVYDLWFNLRAFRHQQSYDHSIIQRFLHIPMPMVIMFVPMGLMMSLLLAWNLTRPMRQFREGFRQVSTGDLSVRLYHKMQRRHDELSAVARDFDAMVERLDVLVKAREELLHDISHELRTPLARLQLATALARQTPENVENSLERIDNEAHKLDKMIGELLTLSRAEHDSPDADQYFDLTSLLDVVVADARFEAQIPQVRIAVSYDTRADYMVQGNAEMIRRCIENVLRNALRFSTAGQCIDIQLSSAPEWLTLFIRDQGPGVEQDKLSSIFDPFVRVKSAQSGKGYGLGLAIVRKIILAHHGSVRAQNRPQGGLEIMLRLPHWGAGGSSR
ncbi:ATP-binding protein [Tatumella sp. UCD-D_suzukii]|uniref:ATP-binding protein n=1 Tax=Tatumella sp. UCD-D_suzukii TaxID=1408192 RepID=UPI00047013BA|nr:ATP-binding protein [Tatumella sp. UCD-D_suzukii]